MEALAREESARGAWLREACGGDEALRAEAEALLALEARYPDRLRPAGPVARPAASAGEPPPVPERIGSYRILGILGRGGMGVVYEGEDPRLLRRVAIKVLPPVLARSAEFRARFEREGQLLASMNHPNIATIHSLEEEEGRVLLTMERVEGTTLAERLSQGALEPGAALDICRQVAGALECAHARAVIHCDLKPGNVMLAAGDRVKVLDFGLARRPGEEAKGGSPEAGSPLGTPGYMSPEQREEGELGPASDIWALGCVLYDCLGGPPRETERDPDPAALPAGTPEAVRGLLARCLVRDPARRLADVTVARRVLDEEIARRAQPEPAPAAGRVPHNLHLPLDDFVGREAERAALRAELGRHRLVTLAGPGGAGKTRLALEAARDCARERPPRFPDGVWFVDLSALREAGRLASAAASVLGAREPGRGTPEEVLSRRLEGKSLLLLLDNCEHLVGPAAEFAAALLGSHERLRILATSREPLAISGERVLHVPPLETPEAGTGGDPREIERFGAVRLFALRAAARHEAFAVTAENAPHIAELCRRLDGLPLAIELAAARVRSLPVESMTGRLEDRLGFLREARAGGQARHRTLDALVEWSHDLLTPGERTLFRRLAVFRGAWSLEAAEAVGSGGDLPPWEVLETLLRLADKSLVEPAPARAGRPAAGYRMLQTIRAVAARKLRESGEEREIRRRHLAHFAGYAAVSGASALGDEARERFDRVAADHENFVAALETSLAEDGDAEAGLRILSGLGKYWNVRGHWREAERRARELLARPAEAAATEARADVQILLATWALRRGEMDESDALNENALGIGRELGIPYLIGRALNGRGGVALHRGDLAAARAFFEQSIAAIADDGWNAIALSNLGVVAEREEDLDRAGRLYEEAVLKSRRAGNLALAATGLSNLAWVDARRGDTERARARFDEALAIVRDLGDRWGEAIVHNSLGGLAENAGSYEEALRRYRTALEIMVELNDRVGVTMVLAGMATSTALAGGAPFEAARLLSALLAIREGMNVAYSEAQWRELQGVFQRLERELGAERYGHAQAEGRRLDLSGAIALGRALAARDPGP